MEIASFHEFSPEKWWIFTISSVNVYSPPPGLYSRALLVFYVPLSIQEATISQDSTEGSFRCCDVLHILQLILRQVVYVSG